MKTRRAAQSAECARALPVALLLLAMCAGVAPAQRLTPMPRIPNATLPFNIFADQLSFETERVMAQGRVVVSYLDMELQAEKVVFNRQTDEVVANGDVRFKRADMIWTGDALTYNLRTHEGDFGKQASKATVGPFNIRGAAHGTTGKEYSIRDAVITTCSLEHPDCHWHMRVREAHFVPDESVEGRGIVLYMGGVPVFYSPYWRHTKMRTAGFNVVPGYTTKMGAFLLTGYTVEPSPDLRTTTHLDYRTLRGAGLGQDIAWHDAKNDTWRGDITGYYAYDLHPVDSDEDQAEEGVDENRYRLRFAHLHNLDERTYVLAQVHYLGDPDVLEDFFDSEHRRSSQPENHVTLTQRGDRYAASLLVRKRLNDFYESVDRTPEARLSMPRQRIGDSPVFYSGETSAARLEKLWPEADDTPAADTFRFHTTHMFLRPSRHFGFLNVIPRAGAQATYYDKLADPVADTNATETASAAPARLRAAGKVRSSAELGLETSFKAFRAWDMGGGAPEAGPRGLRHVVEPYANYTYMPEPSVTTEELVAVFDEVDMLAARNEVRIGARNKLQTKRDARTRDLLDLDAYATVQLAPEEGRENLDALSLDGELTWSENVPLSFDATYNVPDARFDELNSELALTGSRGHRVAAGYRYRFDASSLISGSLTCPLNESAISKWTFTVAARYEAEDARLEEHTYTLERKMDCMVAVFGFSQIPGYTTENDERRDDEYKAWVQIWLTDFPSVGLAVGR